MGLSLSSIQLPKISTSTLSPIKTNNHYFYVVSQQSSDTPFFEYGYNALNFIGIYFDQTQASYNAHDLSLNVPNYNVFIHRLEFGLYHQLSFKELENNYPLEKWRNCNRVTDSTDPDLAHSLETQDVIVPSYSIQDYLLNIWDIQYSDNNQDDVVLL